MTLAAISLLEKVVNRVLRLDPGASARCADLKDKVIRLRITGTRPFEIFVLPSESGLRLHERHEGAADVTLTGDFAVFARLALRRVAPDVAAASELQISGDIDLGQSFQCLLEDIDIDWEEQASRVLGDVVAHQLGRVLRDLCRWSMQARQTLGMDTAEYLQEESRLLPSRTRAAAFREAVETLRREAEHLEKRFERLPGTGR
ncbi:MAG: ubiquinone biosynthesis accessory factor UbiJ [Sulfuricaulis sp.]